MFDEIVEQSDLDKFSETLKKAQMVTLEVERAQGTTQRTYTGRSQTTQYRHNKFHANLVSKGFLALALDEFRSKLSLRNDDILLFISKTTNSFFALFRFFNAFQKAKKSSKTQKTKDKLSLLCPVCILLEVIFYFFKTEKDCKDTIVF